MQVIVFIPGIMGSVLKSGDTIIWPGPFTSFFTGYPYMDKLMSDDLVASDIIRSYLISTQYQALIDDFGTLGFREAAPDSNLVIFPYDWRLANDVVANVLAGFLEKIVADRGADTELILIAHSMGGLIARYYLESGDFAQRPALKKVTSLLTLATPHRGAPVALNRLLGQENTLWLSASQVKQLANDNRFPAVYHLLPPASEQFSWGDANSEYKVNSIYTNAANLGLNLASIQSARNFHSKLNPEKRPDGVRYFCFCGTQQTTACVQKLTQNGAGFNVEKEEQDSAGDGTVPYWSSLLPGFQSFPVGGEHSVIYKDSSLRRILSALLGQPNAFGNVVFALAAPAIQEDVQVSIRDKFIEPKQRVRLVLSPVNIGNNFTLVGYLQIEKADDPLAHPTTFRPEGVPIPINYHGPDADTLGLSVIAPNDPGAYRITYYSRQRLLGSDTFFVQKK